MSLTIQAQVTIGLGEQPVSGALLQLKDKENVSDGTFNAHKGLALPRVTLSQKKELYPMFLADTDDPASGPDSGYATNKLILDKTHTGLIVYNLTENDEKDLCLGLNQWDGEQWNCFEHKMGNAIGHIVSCDDFKISGHYKSPDAYPAVPGDDVALDASNFIAIKLEITNPGAYAIIITPKYAVALNNETNGYFFTANGIFMEKGVYTVTIPGSGTPFWYTPDTPTPKVGDELTVTMNGKPLTLQDGTSCTKNIEVEDYSKKPNYTMDCGRITVHGVYILNQELNPADNYISVWITMDPGDPFVEGSIVYLETKEVDGISFASAPVMITSVDKAAGQKEIILKGSGKPTSVDTKKLTITSNSAISVATCYACVTVAYTRKKILGIKGAGGDSNYGYGLGYWSGSHASMTDIYGLGGRKMLMAPVNFGTGAASTVKIEGYDFINGGNDPSASELQSLIDTHKPDIIVIGYNYGSSNEEVDVLIKYMAKKGVVIAAMENSAGIQRLFERMLNLPSGTISVDGRGDNGSIYTFNYMTNDEILNGPFGDVRERYWGEDASTTRGVLNVPPGMVDIYSNGNCYSTNLGTAGRTNGGNHITICKFKGQNLVWIGDGGFWSRGISSVGVGSDIICPLYYNNDFSPAIGPFGDASGATGVNIYNSYFFVNLMAWAIKTVQFDGYNTPR
jgi:hypothetical protein